MMPSSLKTPRVSICGHSQSERFKPLGPQCISGDARRDGPSFKPELRSAKVAERRCSKVSGGFRAMSMCLSTGRTAAALFAAITTLIFNSLQPLASGQVKAFSTNQTSQVPSSKNENTPDVPFILRMTVREIVIDVIAMDKHNHPVSNMQQSDFEVFMDAKGLPRSPLTISSFHVIASAMPEPNGDTGAHGFRVNSSESCAIGRNSHYEIAFHPDPGDSSGGYHGILVITRRPHVKLIYRRRYYVGETQTLSEAGIPNEPKRNAELQLAACYHPLVPPSISLSAQPVLTTDGSLRFALAVETDSLVFIALSNEARQVQLDYGMCTFDAEGLPLTYGHTSIERVLTPLEYEQAMSHGFLEQIELPGEAEVALVRFVVRDRQTGNLGTLTAAIANPARDALLAAQKEETTKLRESQAQSDIARIGYLPAIDGPIRSFGSIVPQLSTLCGDVYELPQDTSALPDFWKLNPIGSVYTYELDVPAQNIRNSSAIPGVTPKVDWFGIDYYGEFDIETAGDYTFRLFSDDGAKLFIDDDLLIDLDGLHDVLGKEAQVHLNNGRHTLHLPYFQGPGGLALILLIKPPGGQYKVFNPQDFSMPNKAFLPEAGLTCPSESSSSRCLQPLIGQVPDS